MIFALFLLAGHAASCLEGAQNPPQPIQYVLLTNRTVEDLPKVTDPPLEEHALNAVYSGKDFHVERGKSGRFVVIDKQLLQVESELDALHFMTEMFKRPDPFAPVRLGELTREARDAAVRLMYLKGTESTWAKGQRVEDVNIAMGMDVIVRFVGSEQTASALFPARQGSESESAIDRQLKSGPLKFKEGSDGEFPIDDGREPFGQIKTLFFCSPGDHGSAFEESALLLHKYIDEIKLQSATETGRQLSRLQELFKEQLKGMSLPPSTNLGSWPQDLQHFVLGGLRSNWRANGFSAPSDIDAFVPTIRSVRTFLSFNVSYSTQRGNSSPSRTAIEVYRTEG